MPARNYEYGQSVRRGRVFTLRLDPDVEKTLKERMAESNKGVGYGIGYLYRAGRINSLGAFIIAAAMKGSAPAAPPAAAAAPRAKVIPRSRTSTKKTKTKGSLANRIGR